MNLDEKPVDVSVMCLVFNHGPYIRKCLDGFVMQKTNFKFEVLIHDDASTDNSVKIIKEYEEKYPDIIKPIYQTENQYSKGIDITFSYQYPRAKGKYIAFCEGDDYWCDEKKLQKQFDFMEQHPECSICSHRVLVFNALTKEKMGVMPKNSIKYKEKYDTLDYLRYGHFIHTSSFFIRKTNIDQYLDCVPEFIRIAPVGDIPLVLLSLNKGKIGFINSLMSCYRILSQGSWSSRRAGSGDNKRYESAIKMLQSYEAYDRFTKYAYHKEINNMIKKTMIKSNIRYENFDLTMLEKLIQKVYILKKTTYSFAKQNLYFCFALWHKINTHKEKL